MSSICPHIVSLLIVVLLCSQPHRAKLRGHKGMIPVKGVENSTRVARTSLSTKREASRPAKNSVQIAVDTASPGAALTTIPKAILSSQATLREVKDFNDTGCLLAPRLTKPHSHLIMVYSPTKMDGLGHCQFQMAIWARQRRMGLMQLLRCIPSRPRDWTITTTHWVLILPPTSISSRTMIPVWFTC